MRPAFSLMPMDVPWNFEIAGMPDHDAPLLERDNMRVLPSHSHQRAHLKLRCIAEGSGHLDFNSFGLGLL